MHWLSREPRGPLSILSLSCLCRPCWDSGTEPPQSERTSHQGPFLPDSLLFPTSPFLFLGPNGVFILSFCLYSCIGWVRISLVKSWLIRTAHSIRTTRFFLLPCILVYFVLMHFILCISGYRFVRRISGSSGQQVGRRDVVHAGQLGATLPQCDRRGGRPRQNAAQSRPVSFLFPTWKNCYFPHFLFLFLLCPKLYLHIIIRTLY